ncbi:MAG: hypothetical protein WCK51_02190 [Armatimonadota bacterium]
MEQPANFANPQEMVAFAWKLLLEACHQRRHPFHTPTLCTVSARGPEARSVILRDAGEADWTLRANADVRSPKVKQLETDGRSTWQFYSFPDYLQVRCFGHTQVHHLDEIANEAWKRSQLLSRRCYLAPLPPSAPLEKLESNMPPDLAGREPTEEESRAGFQNFAVLQCHVEEMDILSLRYEGNLRLRAIRNQSPIWTAP